MAKKILLGLTTITPGGEWRNKIKEIDELGLKEIALFPTCLKIDERKELYQLLEKTKLKKINSKNENIDDPLQVGKRTYIDLDKKSHLFNHSCNPNTGIRKISEMFALRDIKRGEELTYDYSSTIAPTEWKMKCKCGGDGCRKILSDVLSIPKKQLEYYKKSGAIQKYMKLVLKDVERGKYKLPKYEVIALKKLGNNI